MRAFFATVFGLVVTSCLVGCSEDPKPAAKKEAVPPPAPLTGRQAFQYMFGSARLWAADAQPLTVRSANLSDVKSEPGKAGAWEVIFASEAMARARTYTWSALEAEGFHVGVYPGQQQAWSPGAQVAFSPALIRIDTPEALETATKSAAEYLAKPGKKPPVNFLLSQERASRFPNPVWRVMWGSSVSSAEFTVSVDANTGKELAHD